MGFGFLDAHRCIRVYHPLRRCLGVWTLEERIITAMACQADGLGGRDRYLHACSEMILYSCFSAAMAWAREARVAQKILHARQSRSLLRSRGRPYAQFTCRGWTCSSLNSQVVINTQMDPDSI